MRTTLTLDDDVARKLGQEMRRSGKGMKQAVNEALRRGLGVGGFVRATPFRVRPHRMGVLPGIDPDRMNQMVDELEVEAFLAQQRP